MSAVMSEKPQPLVYFCVDIEASGPVPGLFNMLSIGCVAVKTVEGGRLAPGEDLYLELKPIFIGFDPGAMKVNRLDKEHLEKTGLPPADAMQLLARFVTERTPEGARAIFVGHNAPFDWSFVNYYFHHARIANPWGYSALDSKALAMGVLGLSWPDTNKEVLQKLLELPPQHELLVHRADYDARYQAMIFCALMGKLGPRLAPTP